MKNVEQLLERYLDGETTNAEEQLMRDYFSKTDSVPEEWRVWKALFAYTGTDEADGMKETDGTVRKQKGYRRPTRWPSILAVAASLLLLLGIGLTLQRLLTPQSYAYVDGQRITNRQAVISEAEAALSLVSISDEDDFSALDAFTTD